MFLGTYQTKFTGKGRVILPKKFRSELSDGKIVLSRGFEGCIWGFSQEGWKKEVERQLEVSITEERARFLRRYLFSASEPVELDIQGRFVITRALLIFGNLKEEVIIVGAGDHFEIWDGKLWRVQIERIEKEYGKLP